MHPFDLVVQPLGRTGLAEDRSQCLAHLSGTQLWMTELASLKRWCARPRCRAEEHLPQLITAAFQQSPFPFVFPIYDREAAKLHLNQSNQRFDRTLFHHSSLPPDQPRMAQLI